MTGLIHDQGLVLRWKIWGEGDGSALILTRRHGLFHVIVKGALKSRKRFQGCFDLFNHIEFSSKASSTGDLHFVSEARVLNAFIGIRSSYEHVSMASFFVRLVTGTMEENTHSDSFEEYLLLGSGLQWLHLKKDPMDWVGFYFLLHWAKYQGWLPDFSDLSRIFHLSEAEVEVWSRSLSRSLSVAIQDQTPLEEGLLESAQRWLRKLCQWCVYEHSLRLPEKMMQ